MHPDRGRLVLATRNHGKVREMTSLFAGAPVAICGLEEFGDIPEPIETGLTFAQNACDKALYYAAQTGTWCLADDSGLEVDAIDGAPGVHSARYAAADCPPDAPRHLIDAANNAKLLKALVDVADSQRTARFVCHLALACDGRVLLQAFGTMEGRIGHTQAGDGGFGYDPLFFLPDRGCTNAQLPAGEKNQISHRGKAVRHIAKLISDLLAQAT